jgi:hypothetical protein
MERTFGITGVKKANEMKQEVKLIFHDKQKNPFLP